MFLRSALGKLLNLAGIPGLVRPGEYMASTCDANVSVRVSDLFTTVTVNGLDLYFTRANGRFDGVGFTPAVDCKPESAQRFQ